MIYFKNSNRFKEKIIFAIVNVAHLIIFVDIKSANDDVAGNISNQALPVMPRQYR
jgi:hypothetical protein